jgi:hypothetical protein
MKPPLSPRFTPSPQSGPPIALGLMAVGLIAIAAALTGCADPALDGDAGPEFDAGPPDADPPDALPLTVGLSTLAGRGEPGFQDGARNVASFDDPVNVAVAPDNVLFVADFNNGAIRRVQEDGQTVTFTHQTDFHRPFGIAFDRNGDLYVQTDRNSHNDADGTGPTGALWRVNMSTGAATLLVDGIGRTRGIDVLANGKVVLSDYLRHVIKLYDPATNAVTELAGKADTPGYVDAKGANARFSEPYDIVVCKLDGVESIFVSDFENHRIRQVKLDGTVSTYAGGNESATVNGTLAQARFINPQGLACPTTTDNTLYVSDPGAHVIRRIRGGMVDTIAGDGMPGYVENTDPLMGRFFGLEGIDVTNDGNHLYIADGNLGEDDQPYHRLRRVEFEAQ